MWFTIGSKLVNTAMIKMIEKDESASKLIIYWSMRCGDDFKRTEFEIPQEELPRLFFRLQSVLNC